MFLRTKKIFTSGLIILVLGVSSVGLLAPNVVHATAPVADLPMMTFETAKIPVDIVADTVYQVLLAAIYTAVTNIVSYALETLARDAAVFVASGGNAEAPLFDNRPIGQYFSDFGASVASNALGQIDDIGLLGAFKLCDPSSTSGASPAELALDASSSSTSGSASFEQSLTTGVHDMFVPQTPTCEWGNVKANWTGFLSNLETMNLSSFSKNSAVISGLSDVFKSANNELSIGIAVTGNILANAESLASRATEKHIETGGFIDLVGLTSGKILTPAKMIDKDLEKKKDEPAKTRNQMVISSMGDGELFAQVALNAASVFLNVLISEGISKLSSGMFSDLSKKDIDPFDAYSNKSGNNAVKARKFYQSFMTARPLTVQNFSLLSSFAACPPVGRGLYNCVADTSLISAVARGSGGAGMTIQEAMDEGLLNSAWALIPSSDLARNQDLFCYSYGYCHGNLVKLRKARIVSTGWELAAESTANSESNPITLGEVVAGFYDCNDQNELDGNNPWCHLIDPNWVLKYPETQCKINTYGQLLLASSSDRRKEECVDMPSCIQQDSNGNCTGGYGYCTRETNVWDFRGDSCPSHYASCLTYQDPDGNEVNYLSNTLDVGICTADSAGCKWYNTQKVGGDWPDYTATGILTNANNFTVPSDGSNPTINDTLYRNRLYLTAAVATCTVEDAGCKELVSRKSGTTLNMITNPSFEDDTNTDSLPDGWLVTGSANYSTNNSERLTGTDAVNPGDSLVYQPGIVFTQGAEYTLSLYAKQGSSDDATASVLIALATNDDSTIDFRGFALSGDCAIHVNADGDQIASTLEINVIPTGTTYARYSCTFTVPTLATPSTEVSGFINLMAGDIWYDSIQLEQEPLASGYHVGYSSSILDLTYVKVPPAYLGCTGESTDAADCANYAGACNSVDVGCSAYTPSNGDPLVHGLVSSLDVCPSSCVGYDTYKQEPTLYEPDGNFPTYFIPDSATKCSAQNVGCDQFTNLSTEATANFTYLRACLTNAQADLNFGTSDGAAVFYTWEGSDTSGYQLKTWNLLESQSNNDYPYPSPSIGSDTKSGAAPCTNWTTSATGISCVDDVDTLDTATADCGQHSDIVTNPDCREFYDANGNIHYRPWSKAVTVNDACVTYRKTTIVGAGSDGNADGTDDGQANCTNSGGYYDNASASCRYYGYALESFTCPVKASGCREYTGGRSRNSRQAFIEYFEDGNLTNWDTGSAEHVTLSKESIATNGHSLLSNGHDVWTYVGTNSETGTLGGNCTVSSGGTYCGTLSGDVFTGKTYFVSFWAKGSATLSVGFDTSVDTDANAVIDASFTDDTSAIALTGSWKRYALGPLNMTAENYPDFGNGTSALVFTPADSGTVFYLDNINIREGEDNINIIKDSWVTPAVCDKTQVGGASPQYMLGCQEYTDQNDNVANLKSFSSLCSSTKVGCAAYFKTQESDSTTASVYGAQCNTIGGTRAPTATACYYSQNTDGTDYDATSPYLCTIGVNQLDCTFDLAWYVPFNNLPSHISYSASTVISPADKDIFLVVNDGVECTSDVAGCMEVGLPTFSQDHTAVASWTSTYLMNTPDKYSSILCSTKELACNAYTDNEATTHYFIDPQNQTCDYRSRVTIGTTTFSGWFKTGVDELCDPDYVIGGNVGGLHLNGDAGYDNWVGTCTAEYDTCTNFQDLADLDVDELYGVHDGKSYNYLNNISFDENSLPASQKCNGLISQKAGCALLNDTSNPARTYNESASYMSSNNSAVLFGGLPNELVNPINCTSASTSTITLPDRLTTVDLCANRCRYAADEFYDLNAISDTYIYDGSCYNTADCRPLQSETGTNVKGTCDTTGNAPRLINDANTILKVDRDRQCSEWLSCSDTQTVWDERTNSYKNICGNVGLCTEYSGTGNASFCAAWKTSGTAVVLDTAYYASRDTSWYGDDYSGLSIPELLPVERLTQVNTAAPYTCVRSGEGITAVTSALYDGNTCTDDKQCGGTAGEMDYCLPSSVTDYRLAYVAGICPEDDDGDSAAYGSKCTIGYCANTGSPCNSTATCGADGGDCVVGTCYDVSTTACSNDTNCTSPATCLSGICATENDDANIEDYNDDSTPCASGDTLYTSVNFKTGTCIENLCVLTPSGVTFDTATAEKKVCRGYPEQNSPFDSAVVAVWQADNKVVTTDTSVDDSKEAKPYTFVQNFSAVKTCAFGEDCECSYKKVTYGDSGTPRYYSADTNYGLGIKICTAGGNSALGGTCKDNAACDSTKASGDVEASGDGVCSGATRVDTAMGLDGYCLERDSSTSILGNRNLNACLSWLPVDQLQGSTDLYGKHTDAGYFEETNYCSYLGVYASVNTSWGCLEFDAEQGGGLYNPDGTAKDGCFNENSACPAGFVMLAGINKNGKYTSASDSDKAGAGTENGKCISGEDDCPFMCVPVNSVNNDGDDCLKIIKGYDENSTSTNNPSGYKIDRYWINSVSKTDEAWPRLKNCTTEGVEFDESSSTTARSTKDWAGVDRDKTEFNHNSWGWMPEENTKACNSVSGECGWYDYNGGANYWPYLGCRELTQVATGSSDDGSAAWTDLLKNSNNSSVSLGPDGLDLVDSDYSSFAYYRAQATEPFGATATISALNDSNIDVKPQDINRCRAKGDAGNFKFDDPIGTPTTSGSGLKCSTVGSKNAEFNAGAGAYLSLGGDPNGSSYALSTSTSATKMSLDNADYKNIGKDGVGVNKILNRIFAKSFDIYRFEGGIFNDKGKLRDDVDNDSDGKYIVDGGKDQDGDAISVSSKGWDDRALYGKAPYVYAVDMDNCHNDNCEEDTKHPLTLNDQNEGNVVGSGFYRAQLKFYAGANKNQLPLRRVLVDWGDGTNIVGSTDDNNFYKNHRGLQPRTETSICDTSNKDRDIYEWGMNIDSCDPNYFSYTHIYTCNLATTTTICDDTDDDDIVDNAPCKQSKTATSCIFRPKVHVRDNWGWCGGVCSSDSTNTIHDKNNLSEGCYAGNDYTLSTKSNKKDSECSYTKYPNSKSPGVDPWVYYDGIITVTP